MSEVIADGQPAHQRWTGTGQNGSANRCRRSEFERMSGGRRLIGVHGLVGAEQQVPPRLA
jgi:hypothetical protein